MKNLLFILLLWAGILRAQPPQIVAVHPDTICPGDTICVDIFNPGHEDFQFVIKTKYEWYWYTIPYDPNRPDFFRYCFWIPWWEPQGYGEISIETNVNYPVLFICDVGIEELKWDIKRKSRYFDVIGNEVNLVPGELLIEQRGQYRRKVLVQP